MSNHNFRKLTKYLFPIILFSIILVIGYKRKNDLFQLLINTKTNWLFAGLFFYCLNYLTRACRLQTLAEKSSVPLLIWLKASSLHGYYSYFLPLRSGDFSLLFLLKRLTAIPLATGGSILVRARLLDMFSLGIFLLSSVLLSHKRLTSEIIVAFLLASLILIGAPFLINTLIKIEKIKQIKRIKSFSDGVSQHPMTLEEVGLALLIWFWTGCTLFSTTKALSIPIQFMDIWFLVAIQLPLQLFPIQGIANTGNHELGWVTGFSLLGIAPVIGLKYALSTHIILIIYVVVIGVIGYLIPARHFHSSTRS